MCPPSSPVAFPPVQLRYRVAQGADAQLVVLMLCELVDELGPGDGAERIKALLHEDIDRALASAMVRIFLAETPPHAAAGSRSTAVGLSRADILLQDPIFRLREDHRCGYVDQMYVRAPFRDCGVGQALLQCAEDWFRAQKIQHVILHAAPKAARFYARVGYQPNREMYKRL